MLALLCVVATVFSGSMTEQDVMHTIFEMPTTTAEFEAIWKTYPAGISARLTDYHGASTISLRVEDAEAAKTQWNQTFAAAPARPGERFEAAVAAEAVDATDGNGVIVSLGFYDDQDRRIDHVDSFIGPGVTGKRDARLWAQAPEQTVAVKLLLMLHGFGEAHFSRINVARLPGIQAPPAGETVIITATEDKVTELIGFGFEDDGWFYNAHNAEKGADEAAIALREARIAWMKPDYVRMFFWYNDWNPSLDAETFTWDSDNMQSHYRTLDLYQLLGARINVCGVEWAVNDPWKNPERLACAIGALLEHLIVTKGYTCIQDYTLTNEPDIFFARSVERPAESFETFVHLHVAVKQEFERRGLDLNIVGSDDGNNRAWFAHCVANDIYFELADLFASHFYFSENILPMTGKIFADRTQLLGSRTPVKPFVVAELGFSDGRTKPPDVNPLMGEYAYVMMAMSTFLDGLNAGVAGWSIWCVHEMYYPGASTPMRFGLWDFDPPTWPVRPIYHALALMTRHTNAGDPIYRCDASHPDWIKAARVGERLFWANLSEAAVPIRFSGVTARALRVLTEQALTHDRDCARTLTLDQNTFTAPPRSFGVAIL